MKSITTNVIKNSVFNAPFAGHDLNITIFKEPERDFVVTHHSNIKPVSYFTGRKTELQELRQKIESGHKSVLLSGMGGIGKTHICRKLFDEYLIKHIQDKCERFRHIGYIEYDGDMGSSLQICLKYKKQENIENNLEAAWQELEYLASDGKMLLFVDNVDKTIDSDVGLQRLQTIPCSIILTSRQASLGDAFEIFRIGFLDLAQCREMYKNIRFEGNLVKVPVDEFSDLEYIIGNLVGRHTITVELIAHLSKMKCWSVKDLKCKLESQGFRLQFHKNGELINIQNCYEVLYDMSELTNAEQNILEAFSVLPYLPLATSICNEWMLTDAKVNIEDDILMGLYYKGWLQFDYEQGCYTMHPVFAQFIYDKCIPQATKHRKLIEECQKSMEIPKDGSVLECQCYVPFAESILKKMTLENREKQIRFLSVLAYLLQYMAEYEKAESLYEKLMELNVNTEGMTDLDTIRAYNNLGCIYGRQGKYKEAEKLYKEILSALVKEKHPQTIIVFNNLAKLYEDQNEYKKAVRIYQKMLQIQKEQGLEEHLHTAIIYNNLAQLYDHENIEADTKSLYKKSVAIYEQQLEQDNPFTAIIYNNLAMVYVKEKNLTIALDYFLKAYQILSSKWGKEHPATRKCFDHLKITYNQLCRNTSFEQWMKEKC